MINPMHTAILVSHAAAIESFSGLKLANVPWSLFTNEQISKGMLAESGPWKLFAEAVQALLATPYVAVLFFMGGISRPIDGIFSWTSKTSRLAGLLVQTNILPPCRKTAYQFSGLLSICDAVYACSCPLKTACGTGRIDTIRLESHGILLGDLMLFADAGEPISGKTAGKVTAIIQTLSDSVWEVIKAAKNEETSGGG